MKRVLFSGAGTTDPVRGNHDGALMHIIRHYRPDLVHLFLTKEMRGLEEKDRRFHKMQEYVRENWGGYSFEMKIENADIDDPSDIDGLYEILTGSIRDFAADHPDAELLFNISSGTPQMKIILSIESLIADASSLNLLKNP